MGVLEDAGVVAVEVLVLLLELPQPATAAAATLNTSATWRLCDVLISLLLVQACSEQSHCYHDRVQFKQWGGPRAKSGGRLLQGRKARADSGIATITAQQEASWRERALNAEDRTRELSREIATQRRLVSDLTGQLREPDGTWIEHDRNRLRHENQKLLLERNQLGRERAELHRKLDGARANVSRLNEQRVTQLFPNGPGPTKR